ncbi:hypothetical protein ACFE04_007269 [Oxalis oulophora]
MEKKKRSNSPGKANASRPTTTTTRTTTTNAAASSSRPTTEWPQSSESNKKQRKLCPACSENTGKEKGKGPCPKCTNAAHTNLCIYESLPNSSNIEKNKEDQLRKLGKSIKTKPISCDEAKEINSTNAQIRAQGPEPLPGKLIMVKGVHQLVLNRHPLTKENILLLLPPKIMFAMNGQFFLGPTETSDIQSENRRKFLLQFHNHHSLDEDP